MGRLDGPLPYQLFRRPYSTPNIWVNDCETELKGSLEMVLLIET